MTTVSKFLLTTIIFCASINTFAQDFQGVATYKSHRKVDLKMDKKEMNDEMQEQIQAQLRKQFQQEYTLKFTQSESVYKRNESLEAPNPISSGFQITIAQNTDIFYKNIKEKRYTKETEIFGKQFLIQDVLEDTSWELLKETKNIGEYTCYKAQFKEEVTGSTFNEKGEIEKVTKERVTTAWYTPQIPINNGPDDFQGLPGLILEINDGELTLVCTKIVINPKDPIQIKEPKKGKEVTQAKFDEIRQKKQDEMLENARSSRKGGETFIIKTGG